MACSPASRHSAASSAPEQPAVASARGRFGHLQQRAQRACGRTSTSACQKSGFLSANLSLVRGFVPNGGGFLPPKRPLRAKQIAAQTVGERAVLSRKSWVFAVRREPKIRLDGLRYLYFHTRKAPFFLPPTAKTCHIESVIRREFPQRV